MDDIAQLFTILRMAVSDEPSAARRVFHEILAQGSKACVRNLVQTLIQYHRLRLQCHELITRQLPQRIMSGLGMVQSDVVGHGEGIARLDRSESTPRYSLSYEKRIASISFDVWVVRCQDCVM